MNFYKRRLSICINSKLYFPLRLTNYIPHECFHNKSKSRLQCIDLTENF
uniref:Uncharacterized protein n=1 Tax=Arundo donax TaxID=35708 RepID=A0A0A9FIH3_ARUDO